MTNADNTAVELLEVIRELAIELAPQRAAVKVTLDTDLDRELGFDSLSRVELLLRIERGLGVQIGESAFNIAETPRDLLRAMVSLSATAPRQPEPVEVAPVLGASIAVPAEVETLPDVLRFRADREPERTHALLYEADAQQPLAISYGDLLAGAERLAAGLQQRGLEPGQRASIMLPTSREYLESFFGVLLAGGVPVPIYPPARPSQLEDHLRRHGRILTSASAQFLITVPEAHTVGQLLSRHVETLRAVVTVEELRAQQSAFEYVPGRADDIALLQYTSGSTGQPKGVILSHRDLLANIQAMGQWVNATSDDTFVSWLPLYHDMGLIGAWLGSLYCAMLAVLMPPTTFLTRPWRWLWAIHQHHATISAAPNFAYELCLSKIPDVELEGLRLDSLRLAFNGAEPVSPNTVRRFTERFAAYGFDATALSPVYGLAECAVGLAFPPLGRGPLIDRVERGPFERTGRALPVLEDAPGLEFVACGQPLPGYEIRIVDDGDHEVAERQTGHLQFRGPSATSGYMANPEATARLFHGDWLDSGDLAYIAGSDVYLTSRIKDVIIRAGRNIYPYELEEAVGDLADIRKGCVAVFGSTDPESDIEQLVVVAETRETDPEHLGELRRHIETLATDLLGVAPDDVVLAPPRTVLKTSSGKIRRSACREIYERGETSTRPRPTWLQIGRVWMAGLRTQYRRHLRRIGELAYAGYAYLLLGLILPVAVLCLALLPTLEARWNALGSCSRLLLRLAGVPFLVASPENLPTDRQVVIVANHASYLDGLLMLAVIPFPVTFTAKAELKDQIFPSWFLGRIGAQFVERFDVERGSADARALSAQASAGRSLLFFPEGTFTRYPGLLGFRLGAFVTAAENNLPVVPFTIRGSRSVLRSDDYFPRRGPITVIVGEPLEEQDSGWDAALALRNRARAVILQHVGEQDLALERGLD